MTSHKNQHYIPQFYQRYFSDDGKTIGTYVLDQNKAIPNAPIKTQGSVDYFYSDNTGENNIEVDLGKIEADASSVINRVITDPSVKLDKKEKFSLYCYTILQMGRTMAQAITMKDTADMMVRQMAKTAVEVRKKTGETDLDEVTNGILDDLALKVQCKGGFSLAMQIRMIPINIDLRQKILINETEHPFITSDDPASLYNLFLERVNHNEAGMGCRGVFIYLPITPKFAVVLYDDKVYKIGCSKHEYVVVSQRADVDELNKLTTVNAFKTLYYKPSITKLSVLEKMAVLHERYCRDDKVEEIIINSEEGKSVVGVHRMPLRCNLRLGFVKLQEKYKLITEQSFDPSQHLYREILEFKDELMKEYFGNC